MHVTDTTTTYESKGGTTQDTRYVPGFPGVYGVVAVNTISHATRLLDLDVCIWFAKTTNTAVPSRGK